MKSYTDAILSIRTNPRKSSLSPIYPLLESCLRYCQWTSVSRCCIHLAFDGSVSRYSHTLSSVLVSSCCSHSP